MSMYQSAAPTSTAGWKILEAPEATGIAYGPVPSRRFGSSLGVNNIPPKVCSYSCVYCQVGRTARLRCRRRDFHGAATIAAAVHARVDAARRRDVPIDRISFVPDGEPTLDTALLEAIRLLQPVGIPITVITNSSMLDRSDVRETLCAADHVSVKVDAVRETAWRKVNRPHRRIDLESILEGMRIFASSFEGGLTTETMLVAGVNDAEDELRATAAFVADLDPDIAYLSVPTRPPAEAWVGPPDEAVLARSYEVFRAAHPRVETLLGYEGNAFASTGDTLADLLSITAVHPMREGAVRRLLSRGHVPWSALAGLVASGALVEVRYGSHRYYLRPIGARGAERS